MLKISAYFSKLSNLAYTDRSNITEEQVLWQPSSGQVPEENKSVLTQWAIKRLPLFAHHLLGKNCQAVWHIIWRNTAMAMPLVWAIPALHPPPREQQSHCQDSSKAALVHAWAAACGRRDHTSTWACTPSLSQWQMSLEQSWNNHVPSKDDETKSKSFIQTL